MTKFDQNRLTAQEADLKLRQKKDMTQKELD